MLKPIFYYQVTRQYIIPNYYVLKIKNNLKCLNGIWINLVPLQVYSGDCVKISQNLTVVSPDPLAKCLPSGLKLTDITASA